MTLTVGSLFSGIGGLDLGLERAGMTVRWQSEIDPYASRVLAHHWPEVPNHGDITTIDWERVGPVDLICGGFPCQPFSVAGRQRGIADERWMWPWFAAAVRMVRPRYVLVENVPALISDRAGFGRVVADLATLGYDTEWDCIPAATVGAPHQRDRLFVVAYADREQHQGRTPTHKRTPSSKLLVADTAGQRRSQGRTQSDTRGRTLIGSIGGSLPDTSSPRLERRGLRWAAPQRSRWWAVEPDVGRVANGVPARVDRLRCLGNAVVPQVAEHIGRLILAR